eukprot:12900603-Prorocentrum_lima.AAC.1
MITALQSATLLNEVEFPRGDNKKITEKMLCGALNRIHTKQGEALMNLSEVCTFHSINMKERHWDRDI